MDSTRIQAIAAALDEAVRQHQLIPPFADLQRLEDAYAAQDAGIGLRRARGERVVAKKMGLTSRAKMVQMGVYTPIYGVITDGMRADDGATLQPGDFVHPRIEPEIVFRLGRELAGPTTAADALRCVEAACVGLEILDSRYQDFKYDLPNVVADNASGACVVLGGEWIEARGLDLGNLGVVLEVNGRPVEIASSAAILDHPARSLAELANMLARRERTLSAGLVILTGAATQAVPFRPGDRVCARVERLGCARVRMAGVDSAVVELQPRIPATWR